MTATHGVPLIKRFRCRRCRRCRKVRTHVTGKHRRGKRAHRIRAEVPDLGMVCWVCRARERDGDDARQVSNL